MRKFGTIIGFTIAVAFISIGLLQHQQSGVLAKAINICLECIGIG